MASKRWRHVLYVSYDLNHPKWGSLDSKLDRAVRKYSDGAGTGMGMRDIDWSFDTKAEALSAEGRIKALNLKHVTVDTGSFEDED